VVQQYHPRLGAEGTLRHALGLGLTPALSERFMPPTPANDDSQLRFIRRLARRNAYPVAVGTSRPLALICILVSPVRTSRLITEPQVTRP
jgi:hypothetical protein